MNSAPTQEFILADYRVGQTLGEGTFGKVRLAVHLPTQQKVAVKTLQKQKITDQSDIERITREICILKLLHHPNIAQLYEIIETNTDIHLIMEYAPGGELFDHIVKHKKINQTETVRFMQQLLAGVEYIHQNGIVHRDLKPENLLLDQHKNIKIVDFGLSNQYRKGQKLKTACGSPCYAAPEMIAGKKYDCQAVDVWSSGIILFAMLCGYLPFEDPSTNKLYKKILAGEFELPKFISPASKDILKCILNVNPENRYTIQQIRSTEWFQQLGYQYAPKGILIGKNPLEVNQTVLQAMQAKGIDPLLVRNYVTNNRHNSLTAYYYLLKKKLQNQPNYHKLISQPNQQPRPRNDSPLIYRPQARLNQTVALNRDKNQKRDDSLDATKIINCLVEANRQKLKTPNLAVKGTNPNNNFQKAQDFKMFPKNPPFSQEQQTVYLNQNLLNSRRVKINNHSTDHYNYEPSTLFAHTPKPIITFAQTPNKNTEKPSVAATLKQALDPSHRAKKTTGGQKLAETLLTESKLSDINKRRQELEEQLKMISMKIDNSINELKARNTSLSTTNTPQHQTSNQQQPTFKTETSISPTHVNINFQHRQQQQSPQSFHTIALFPNQRLKTQSLLQSPTRFREVSLKPEQSTIIKAPKIHTGPFNSQCMFLEDPKVIINKIQHFLRKDKITYCIEDGFTITAANQIISVQSIQRDMGLHIVNFAGQSTPWTHELIRFLSS